MMSQAGCVLRPKKTKKKHQVKPCPKHTFTPFFPNNTFFLHLHIPPTHFHHLCRETHPCSSAEHAQTMAFYSTKRSKEQASGGKKKTWCLYLPSSTLHTIVFLSVSSIHPTLEPSLTRIPSLPIPYPPSHTFNPNTTAQQEWKRCSKAFDELFCSFFPLFLLVVTIYHWIDKSF